MADQRIELRATPAFRKHLEGLATARGQTLSAAIKSAVMEAAVPEGGVPDEAEVLELLGAAARGGSVAAMKELRVYHRERSNDESDQSDPLDGLDELAVRRVA